MPKVPSVDKVFEFRRPVSVIKIWRFAFNNFVHQNKDGFSVLDQVGNFLSSGQFIQDEPHSPNIALVIVVIVSGDSFRTPKHINQSIHVDTNVDESAGDSEGVFDVFGNSKV